MTLSRGAIVTLTVVFAVFFAAIGWAAINFDHVAGVGSPAQTAATTTSPINPPAASASDGITRFGATRAAWDATHDADGRFSPGAAYDPDARLPDPEFSARYRGVHESRGRIAGYDVQLPDGTRLGEARAEALAELPADAAVKWERAYGACVLLSAHSRTLAAAVGDPQFDVLIVFWTYHRASGEEAPLDPTNVNRVGMSSFAPKAAPDDGQC